MLNRLTRRHFLQLIVSTIATQTLLSSVAVADAIEQYPEDKLSIASRKARAVVALKHNIRDARLDMDWVVRAEANRTVRSEMSRAGAFLNEAFDPNLAPSADVIDSFQ